MKQISQVEDQAGMRTNELAEHCGKLKKLKADYWSNGFALLYDRVSESNWMAKSMAMDESLMNH